MKLKILSGGAAQGLVATLAPAFEAQSGCTIEGDFGAVGGMKERIVGGEHVDLIILTRAIVDDLSARGLAVAETIADVGKVETGLAVRSGDPAPTVTDGADLKAALLAADAIYFPDPKLSTAGIHFASVLAKLGIDGDLQSQLRPFPNGATAMRAMAAAAEQRPFGCTQVTEIMSTPGVELIGLLPEGYGLATIYTAAVSTNAANPEQARAFAQLLTGAATLDARSKAGFSG